MTTIACNLKEIAGDTRVTWEGVGTGAFAGIKLFPATNGAIYGVSGSDCTGSIRALEWLQGDRHPELMPLPPEYEHGWDWKLIELSKDGIAIYNPYLERDMTIEPVLAIGSGAQVAMWCMKYAGMSPAEAVHAACQADDYTDVPIYTASLADPVVRVWKPTKEKH